MYKPPPTVLPSFVRAWRSIASCTDWRHTFFPCGCVFSLFRRSEDSASGGLQVLRLGSPYICNRQLLDRESGEPVNSNLVSKIFGRQLTPVKMTTARTKQAIIFTQKLTSLLSAPPRYIWMMLELRILLSQTNFFHV